MELNLLELVQVLWRRKVVILAALLVGAAGAFSYTNWNVTPMYTASASMYVYSARDAATGASEQTNLSLSARLVSTYVVILTSDTVMESVAKASDLGYTSAQIRGMVSASAINETEAFRVNVTNANARHAQLIANTIAKIAPQEIIRVVRAGSVEVIDYAKLPSSAYTPLRRNTVVGGVAAAAVAVMIVLLVAILDTTIHSESDLTSRFDAPILGVIPSIGEGGPKGRRPKGGGYSYGYGGDRGTPVPSKTAKEGEDKHEN